MTGASPSGARATALVALARARAEAIVAAGRWSQAREAALAGAFERAAAASLAVRAPAERSVLVRRVGRIVPRAIRPHARRAIDMLDRALSRIPRRG